MVSTSLSSTLLLSGEAFHVLSWSISVAISSGSLPCLGSHSACLFGQLFLFFLLNVFSPGNVIGGFILSSLLASWFFAPFLNLPPTPKPLHLCHLSPELKSGKVHFCPVSNLIFSVLILRGSSKQDRPRNRLPSVTFLHSSETEVLHAILCT